MKSSGITGLEARASFSGGSAADKSPRSSVANVSKPFLPEGCARVKSSLSADWSKPKLWAASKSCFRAAGSGGEDALAGREVDAVMVGVSVGWRDNEGAAGILRATA